MLRAELLLSQRTYWRVWRKPAGSLAGIDTVVRAGTRSSDVTGGKSLFIPWVNPRVPEMFLYCNLMLRTELLTLFDRAWNNLSLILNKHWRNRALAKKILRGNCDCSFLFFHTRNQDIKKKNKLLKMMKRRALLLSFFFLWVKDQSRICDYRAISVKWVGASVALHTYLFELYSFLYPKGKIPQ